jgi:hypothetical protein
MSKKVIPNYNSFKIGMIFGILFLFIGSSIAPSTGVIIKEINVIKQTTSNIGGIYYLRDNDPLNWSDVGSLLKELPTENELTQCGMFVNFHYAEPGNYMETITIYNIYYRFWQKRDNEGIYEIGYSTSAEHSAPCDEYLVVDTKDYIFELNDYRLKQVMQITDPDIAVFEGDEIYNFTIKSFGPNPNILCNPDQYSFIILNLEDNETLLSYDRDGDYLNDFEELYIYYTNPFDSDTDNDGYSDYVECNSETNPNDSGEHPLLNNPPNRPIGSGPNSGKIGILYSYYFEVRDIDGDSMFLYVDWGDGDHDGWIGPYNSGTIVEVNHTWNKRGTFVIRYKSKDILNIESKTGTLSVTIPRNKATNNAIFYQYLEKFPILHQLLNLIKL